MKNRLDEHKDAYHEEFKFHDENILMLSWYVQRIIKSIRDNKAKSIVSLGIGHKIVSKTIISDMGKSLEKYFIIEGSKEIIKEFKKNTRLPAYVSLVNSLFEEFITKKKFDAIEMGFILEHVDDPLFIIKKYVSFLKQNGSVFIAVPNAKSLHRQIGYQAGMIDNFYKLSKCDLELGHKRYFDMDSLVELIIKSGLKIVNIEGIFLKPFSTSQLKSSELPSNIIRALCDLGIQYPAISNAIYIEATL
jgi:2-polyprenyl-3-methyl-5-hydroxy-6-metoxy-1,4-benzoquinol methylase